MLEDRRNYFFRVSQCWGGVESQEALKFPSAGLKRPKIGRVVRSTCRLPYQILSAGHQFVRQSCDGYFTPLGEPVEPEVNTMAARSLGKGFKGFAHLIHYVAVVTGQQDNAV